MIPISYQDSNGETFEGIAKILVQEDHRKRLPTFSNSPNSVYIRLAANGTIDQIRIYKNYRPVLDVDYDQIPKDKIPQKHWHEYDHSGIPPELVDREIGRGSIHRKEEEAPPGIKHLFNLLTKKPSDIEGYEEVK